MLVPYSTYLPCFSQRTLLVWHFAFDSPFSHLASSPSLVYYIEKSQMCLSHTSLLIPHLFDSYEEFALWCLFICWSFRLSCKLPIGSNNILLIDIQMLFPLSFSISVFNDYSYKKSFQKTTL